MIILFLLIHATVVMNRFIIVTMYFMQVILFNVLFFLCFRSHNQREDFDILISCTSLVQWVNKRVCFTEFLSLWFLIHFTKHLHPKAKWGITLPYFRIGRKRQVKLHFIGRKGKVIRERGRRIQGEIDWKLSPISHRSPWSLRNIIQFIASNKIIVKNTSKIRPWEKWCVFENLRFDSVKPRFKSLFKRKPFARANRIALTKFWGING